MQEQLYLSNQGKKSTTRKNLAYIHFRNNIQQTPPSILG
uniref:Uncharacterized protein n=1 Tax=Arundo donax TaxID=35708 RepID=A0A0A8ZMD7_ARUDO